MLPDLDDVLVVGEAGEEEIAALCFGQLFAFAFRAAVDDHLRLVLQTSRSLATNLDPFLHQLAAGCDIAQANIVIGASALRQRQCYIRLIEEAWRPGWFDDIPQSIRPPAWTRPENLPRDVLVQITANAKQGIPIATALTRWTEHVARRTDHGRRRREGIKGPTVPHLILLDIKRLNLPIDDADHGRRTSRSPGE